METKEILSKLKYLIKKKQSFAQICEELQLKDYEIIGLVELLKQDGELVDYVNGEIVKLNKPVQQQDVYQIPSKSEQLKLLALSDTHFGSKWDNVKLVNYAYELAEQKGADLVIHSGDLVEGDYHNKRPEHIYQVKAHGLEEQLNYFCKHYPKSNVPTYYITGNHDLTFMKTGGADIGKMVQREREDLTYLGADLANIKVGKINIMLRHGSGGSSYAKSYKLQKYCETIPAAELPDMIFQGHLHFSGFFINRGIHCFNVPSLQSYTPYAKSLGLPEEKGFWFITADLDSKGNIIQLTPELYSFNEGVKEKPKVLRKKQKKM